MNEKPLAELRREYTRDGLRRADLAADPITQFQAWFKQAVAAAVLEPNAMVLSTVNGKGHPSSRVVLLKAIDARGFSFFSNYQSRKGQELARNPEAALNFFWAELERQVCIAGTVTKLPRSESEQYFQQRPKGSRLGAWASIQSSVVASRDSLEGKLKELEGRYPGEDVPTPDYWGGYVLAPRTIEFWQGRPSRLHDRLRFTRAENSWKIDRLSP